MDTEKLSKIIEALLFVQAKPLTVQEISDGLEISEDEIKKATEILQKKLSKRGIVLLKDKLVLELTANKENSFYIEKFRKKELRAPLSRTSLETLAIIAYRGPLARFEIENIRGVNCVWILRKLLIRNLIKRSKKGLKIYYSITRAFLQYLGLEEKSQLPDYAKMQKSF